MSFRWSISKINIIKRPFTTSTLDLPYRETVPLSYEQYHRKNAAKLTNETPILFIHGFMGNKNNYKSIGKKVSSITSRPTFGLDIRNHGESPHALPLDNITMTKDVIKFIKENMIRGNSKKVSIVGHSMGAKVAMLASLMEPELIKDLCIVDNIPSYMKLDKEFERNLLGMIEIEKSNIRKDNKHWMQAAKDILRPYQSDELVQLFLLSNLSNKKSDKSSPIDYNDDYVHFQVPVEYLNKHQVLKEVEEWPESDTRDKQYKGKTIIFKAKHSNFITNKDVFDRNFPNNTFVEYDCGHWLISEKPKEFIKEYTDFLND